LYTIDHTKKPQRIKMYLARPNRTIIGNIDAYNVVHTINFGQINELTLTIPHLIAMNNELVRNQIFDLVKEKYLIKVVFGSDVEWYRINKKIKTMDGTSDSITLECFSLAYDLKYQKLIDYNVTSYNCLQVLTDCLNGTNWTVGYINSDFNLKYRQFDISSSTKLDFILGELCTTFKAMPTFDTVNRKVNIWKEEELSVYKGLWIEYGKYLETVQESIVNEDIVTRLIVTSNENVSINSANPTGQSFIDDFSYFLYPFNRDESRNVLSSSYFMSDELCHALLDYNELINANADTFSKLLKTKESLQNNLTSLNNQLQVLNDELNVILDDIQLAKQIGDSTTELIQQRDSKQLEIDNKESKIEAKQIKIDENDLSISTLNNLLKFENNFKGDLLVEIYDYIQEEEWSDDNQINDSDYFYAASDHLKTISIPPINLSLSIINFFEIVEEQYNWDRMSIGDIIRVRNSNIGIDVKAKISQIVFNYDEGTINLTISNVTRPDSIQQKLQRAFYKIDKLNTDVNKRKVDWNSMVTNFNERNDRIKTTPTSPTLASNCITYKQNDNGSVNLSFKWTYPSYNKTKKNADNIDGFIIYLHASTENEKYIFGSNIAEESTAIVSNSKRTYTFQNVPSNLYYVIGIKAYRDVDDNISKEGVIFSKLVSSNGGIPYMPSTSITFKGNFSGKLNGVTHTVSETPPSTPDTNDTWFDTTLNVQKRYDGTGWKTASAGDASTIGGVAPDPIKTPNTIPVRDSSGVIDTDITGNAVFLNGKSDTDFATLDETGSVPLTQLDSVTSIMPSINVGSYTGDGTVSKEINVGFAPKLIRIYTTNSTTDASVFIPSATGGFLLKNNSTNLFIEGEGTNKDIPSDKYGKLSTNGFRTGNTTDHYINKLDVVYYWEAVK
jgi:hypothetical protein